MRSELKVSYKMIINVLSENNLLVEHKLKNPDGEVSYISYNSNNIKPGTLFFCKGVHFKEEYLKAAVDSGAICYAAENRFESVDLSETDCFVVSDIRQAIAVIAPLYYNYSYEKLKLIGVTGTKGKTTTVYFLKNIFDEYTQSRTGFNSTIQTYTGMRDEASSLTTPEPCDLQRYFYEASESGIEHFTMEISSQAYKTDRVHGIHFDNGIFLNIAEDHIGPAEHEDFDDYLNCKLQFIKNCSNVVINAETDYLSEVLSAAENAERITLYGSESSKDNCDYYSCGIKSKDNLLYFYVISDKYKYFEKFAIKIHGLFNVENALAAVTMAKTLGVDDESIRRGLLKTEVPGRMTVFENNGVTVVVDYAHNLLSFTKLYESLRIEYGNRRIISVGGAPGGKSYGRRRDFAEIVGANSEYIYLTAEDPFYEDVNDICDDLAGRIANTPYEIIPDRKEAVEKAIASAKSGDIVVLLAKGGEMYQKVRGNLEPYESDIAIAKNMLFADTKANVPV